MSALRRLTNGYALLIRLYPADFRAEFGAEMAAVFAATLHKSHRAGLVPLAATCLRELIDFPANLLREHASSLRKEFFVETRQLLLDPRRASFFGGLGFGLGFALLILFRTLLNPTNATLLTDFGASLARETLLFVLVGVLGGALIGFSSGSAGLIRRLALAGGLGCGLAGGLGTISLYLLYASAAKNAPDQFLSPWLNSSAVGMMTIAIGGLTGTVMGSVLRRGKRTAYLALAGGLGFGAAHIASQLTSNILYNLWMRTPFYQLWMIPLGLAAAITGLVGGAALGWAMGQQKEYGMNAPEKSF